MITWSEQQKAIFTWFESAKGNLVVRARAGTGKTTTIIEAVRHIPVQENGSPPRVLVCAYNKRIAEELSRRLNGTTADAKTLHSLGFYFLRGAWGNLRLDDEVEDERIVKAVQAEFPGDDDLPWDVRIAVKKLISIAKSAEPLGEVDDLIDLGIAHGCEVDNPRYSIEYLAKIARWSMDVALEPDAEGRITFDDMLFIPAVLKMAVPIYDFVLVDEAQDMSASQLILAQAACKKDGHVVVVGDDRQAIYGFRGADSTAIDRLKRELNAHELGLNTTYRCPSLVVAMAQQLVPDFFAAPEAPEGAVEMIKLNELKDLVDPGDVILSRTNAPLVPLCLGFIRRGMSAKIEGRDIGKMLLKRAKKIGGSHCESVEEFIRRLTLWAKRARVRAAEQGRVVDAAFDRINDIEATLIAMTEDAETVLDVYQRCERLFADNEGNGKGIITLSTVHKAKGLEWPRVFLLEPTLYCNGKRTEDREEVNLHYVAVTRAQRALVVVQGAKVE